MILVATWGAGNVLAVRSEDGEVIARAGPDVEDVLLGFREPARRWTEGDSVLDTAPGDPRHVHNVLASIPGVTLTPRTL